MGGLCRSFDSTSCLWKDSARARKVVNFWAHQSSASKINWSQVVDVKVARQEPQMLLHLQEGVSVDQSDATLLKM
jgi:hypothetical protein